jgi:hypothetical protein
LDGLAQAEENRHHTTLASKPGTGASGCLSNLSFSRSSCGAGHKQTTAITHSENNAGPLTKKTTLAAAAASANRKQKNKQKQRRKKKKKKKKKKKTPTWFTVAPPNTYGRESTVQSDAERSFGPSINPMREKGKFLGNIGPNFSKKRPNPGPFLQ